MCENLAGLNWFVLLISSILKEQRASMQSAPGYNNCDVSVVFVLFIFTVTFVFIKLNTSVPKDKYYILVPGCDVIYSSLN